MCFGVKFGSDLFLMEEAPATSPYQGVVGTGRLAEKRYIWRCHSDAASRVSKPWLLSTARRKAAWPRPYTRHREE